MSLRDRASCIGAESYTGDTIRVAKPATTDATELLTAGGTV
jgi:hypothetical protein